MIRFALPEREAKRIRHLLEILQRPGRVGNAVHLDAANAVPGWWIQKVDGTERVKAARREGGVVRVWTAVTPRDRNKVVPWAVPPFTRFFTRPELVEFLREEWVPDAVQTLQEDAAALAEVQAAVDEQAEKEEG